MSDLTPETLAELQRLLNEAKSRLSSPRRVGKTYAMDRLRYAAVNALPALLDAAAERDRLAGLLDEPRRSGCAVEIAGVRIAPCDERGQTADMRALDTAADHLAHMTEARDNARAEVERLTAQVEAVRKLHRPDHYLGEPGDADCPHDADYEGPRHFENDEGMWLCEDTASDESYCTGCPTDWDGEREDYPCPTIRAFGAES